MTNDNLLNECRTLALIVAPELRERPLYVVDAADFADLPIGGDCLGWAVDNPTTFHAAAERLGSVWTTNGPIIALDFAAISEAGPAAAFERRVLNVMLHETAHVLPPVVQRAEWPELAAATKVKDTQLEILTLRREMPEPPFFEGPHNLRFAVRCLHLWVRACLAGYEIPVTNLFTAENPYATAEVHYLPFIVTPALELRGELFAVINESRIPDAFQRLWQADVECYRHFQQC